MPNTNCQIVVSDGYTLNPGDLSWQELQQLGPCDIYDRSSAQEIISRAGKAEVVLVNKVAMDPDTISKLPALKYIGVLATGTNVVDLNAARARGILVTNVPAYGTKSVAQTTMALLLELSQHAGHHDRTVHDGKWSRSPDWSYWETPLIELDGLTMGIIGFGRIGSTVAQLATAFGMKVLAFSPHPKTDTPQVRFVDLDSLFRQSDVVSLHCPLTPETHGMVNSARLSLMKRSAFLLNTSRGALLDEAALAAALNSGQLAGAGIDVLSVEPPPETNPLLKAKNCVITPHLAWATRAARARLMKIAVENVRAYLGGKPQNVVNLSAADQKK